MIDGLKPYPDMKPSGVAWLGDVPAHWELRRIKTLFKESDERTADRPGVLLSLTRARGLLPQSEASNRIASVEDLSNYKVCKPGNLVMNRMQAWSGMFALSELAGLVSPDYCVFHSIGPVDGKFFEHLFKTPRLVQEFTRRSKGIGSGFNRLYTPDFGAIAIASPPLAEQIGVVRFLAHADRLIGRYIRAKQALISLLEEQKQAIIHRAVTRGADSRVRLRPSGLECLGNIPEHWEVRRLKTILQRLDQGVSPQAENYLADGNSWGVLKAGCVNAGVFRETEHKRLPASFPVDETLAVRCGDVLVSRASGSPRFVGSSGRVGPLQYQLILSDKTFRLVFRPGIDPDFMVAAMNSPYYRLEVALATSGAEGLANNLPVSSLRDFVFAIPPFGEAKQIVERVRSETNDLERLVSDASIEVALLREYRSGLITEVVTGKLDVREAAARLPVEVDARDAEVFDAADVFASDGDETEEEAA